MTFKLIPLFSILIILFILPQAVIKAKGSEPEKKPRMIILPLKPENPKEYDGTGLGIHFLLGNVVAVHTGLKEFWFGWRLTRIFNGKTQLQAYCKGKKLLPDIARLGKEQEIQYWLEGTYKKREKIIFVTLKLFDTQYPDKKNSLQIPLDTADHAIGFRKSFLAWLETCGIPMSKEQSAKVVWTEKMTNNGLDFLGQALLTTYHDYFSPKFEKNHVVRINWFDKALAQSPESYLIHDLKGWAYYKNKKYKKALKSFKTAVELNKNGIGALSGMMWCYIYTNDQKKAVEFALTKADVRNENHEKATTFVFKKMNSLK